MNSLDIGPIAKRYGLSIKEQNLLKKILSFSVYKNSLLNIKAFENYIQNWIEKNISITEEDEKLLKNIREKFNFFDPKYPLFNTKYIKISQEAFIINGKKTPIKLYKNGEKKLFWQIDQQNLKNLHPKEKIKIGFLRKEDKKFYIFETKILDINSFYSITLIKTDHSKKFEIRESRSKKRYDIKIPLQIKYKTLDKKISTIDGVTKNVSFCGMQILLKNFDKDIDQNENISIKINLDNKNFYVDGEIKYIIKDIDTNIGVELKNIKKDFQSALIKEIKRER